MKAHVWTKNTAFAAYTKSTFIFLQLCTQWSAAGALSAVSGGIIHRTAIPVTRTQAHSLKCVQHYIPLQTLHNTFHIVSL